MNRISAFSKRVAKEILRDPLSYIFCLGFPIVMLTVMTVVNESIPEQAGLTIFRIDNLAGGIIIFGQTFIMLFTALTVSKDRTGSFMLRLFASPMSAADFTLGYYIPMMILSLCQSVITLLAAMTVSIILGEPLSAGGLLLAAAVSVVSSVLYISFGFIFGSVLSDKSAPGMCSIIISLASFLGSVWFDAEATGGILLKLCRCLPFLYSVKSVRAAIDLDMSREGFLLPLAMTAVTALVFSVLSAVFFRKKMRSDLK